MTIALELTGAAVPEIPVPEKPVAEKPVAENPVTQDLTSEKTALERPKSARITPDELPRVLELHRQWLESSGAEGEQADLSRADLHGLDLTDARLEDAIINQAKLRGADLLLASLEGAQLIQADLRDTNLLGTKLREADLQGADLTGARALQSEQLAGANLFGAVLPESISLVEAVKEAGELARRTAWFLIATLVFTALACLRVITISDARLLGNSPTLPLAALGAALPLIPFFLFCPVLILGLFVFLHFHLQRLWEACAALPAILPDELRSDESLPWFAKWPGRCHYCWLRQNAAALSALQAGLSKLVLYAPAPAALLLFWMRYLTEQDLRGTALHILLAIAGVAVAVHFHAAANRAFSGVPLPPVRPQTLIGSLRHRSWQSTLGPFAFALLLLSVGCIFGAPRTVGSAAHPAPRGMRTWAADALWLVGYSPFPQVTESDVSAKPRNWSGRDDDLSQVHGANMNGLSLRYVQGYRAFFANAHLLQADLAYARLPEADLRAANLRQAVLRGAILDGARFNRSTLQEADLRETDLTQADLRAANLSYAIATGAILIDARLDDADLYTVQLQGASLQRASLAKADLRAAQLQGADLGMTDLRGAYLSSARLAGARLQDSHLGQALLMEADLQRTDLRGADFDGAVLQGANLSGANLQGAHLEGALGLTAAQVCSAIDFRQAQLNSNLQAEIDAQCPAR